MTYSTIYARHSLRFESSASPPRKKSLTNISSFQNMQIFFFKGFEDYERQKNPASHVPIHNRNSHVKMDGSCPWILKRRKTRQAFPRKIVPNGLYLLDESENSLSAQQQIELVAFIEDMTRFTKIVNLSSLPQPFVLSIKEAKICTIWLKPVDGVAGHVGKWSDLQCFFQCTKRAFEDEKDVPINKNLLNQNRKRSGKITRIHSGITDHSYRFNYHCCVNRSNRLWHIASFFCFLVSGIDQATADSSAIIKDHCLSWVNLLERVHRRSLRHGCHSSADRRRHLVDDNGIWLCTLNSLWTIRVRRKVWIWLFPTDPHTMLDGGILVPQRNVFVAKSFADNKTTVLCSTPPPPILILDVGLRYSTSDHHIKFL